MMHDQQNYVLFLVQTKQSDPQRRRSQIERPQASSVARRFASHAARQSRANHRRLMACPVREPPLTDLASASQGVSQTHACEDFFRSVLRADVDGPKAELLQECCTPRCRVQLFCRTQSIAQRMAKRSAPSNRGAWYSQLSRRFVPLRAKRLKHEQCTLFGAIAERSRSLTVSERRTF